MENTPETYPETQPVPYQYEIAILSEECGEVVQIAGKISRFGMQSYDPSDKDRKTNHALLHDEVGDILAAVEFGIDRGLFDRETLMNRMFFKRKKMHMMAPNPILPTAVVAQAPEVNTKTAYTVFGVVLLLVVLAFYVGTRLNAVDESALETRVALATKACFEKHNDIRCNDLADLIDIKASEDQGGNVQ